MQSLVDLDNHRRLCPLLYLLLPSVQEIFASTADSQVILAFLQNPTLPIEKTISARIPRINANLALVLFQFSRTYLAEKGSQTDLRAVPRENRKSSGQKPLGAFGRTATGRSLARIFRNLITSGEGRISESP